MSGGERIGYEYDTLAFNTHFVRMIHFFVIIYINKDVSTIIFFFYSIVVSVVYVWPVDLTASDAGWPALGLAGSLIQPSATRSWSGT